MGAGGCKRKGKVNNILLGIGGYMLCQLMMPRLLAAMSVFEHAYVKTALKKKIKKHMLKILFQEQETSVLSYHRAVA